MWHGRVSAACLLVALTGGAAGVRAGVQQLDLDGAWQVRQAGRADGVAAAVPGCIHTDLLAAGKIADPFLRDNASGVQWVGQAGWVYSRHFDVPAGLLDRRHVVLHCDGLDTLASISVNGRPVGRTDNSFRTYEFDVRPVLRAGDNQVEVTFDPVGPYIDRHARPAAFPGVTEPAGSAVRKPPFHFGWDFAPRLVTCGIWRPIGLRAWDAARLADVSARADLDDPAAAAVVLDVSADTDGGPLSAAATVSLGGQVVARAAGVLDEHGNGRLTAVVPHPQLWWPVGMGSQPLYAVHVDLTGAAGRTLDGADRRIGLRTVELVRRAGGQPMGLRVNGRPFFAKGADCIPVDVFANRETPDRLRRLVADALGAHVNVLRFWGGGHYEDDALLDACDEAGLLVWEEFKFACSAYPAYDPAFVENVRAECRDQVRRLRSHPCIGVWCGNNEVRFLLGPRTVGPQMDPADYLGLFDAVIGGVVREGVPGAAYVDGSPSPAGDEHNWAVWHGDAAFAQYARTHTFTTEFGFQSFPHPATVDAYTDPGDRASLLTPVMRAHQHNGDNRGNEKIIDTTARYFRHPRDVTSAMWVSQILQAYGLTRGIEHWRADWPRSTGCMVWQLDDCWPGPTWSTVDYYGRWKAAQYRIRAAYAPVMVTAAVDVTVDPAAAEPTAAGTAAAHLRCCSDLLAPAQGTVGWTLTDTAGADLGGGSATVALPAGTAAVPGPTVTVPEDALRRLGSGGVLLWITLAVDGQPTSHKLVTFAVPKRLAVVDPALAVAGVEPAGDGFDVTLTAAHPALWAWLELAGDPDARYDDNFVDVRGDRPVRLHVTPSRPVSADDFRRRLRARSLFDTYDPTVPAPTPPVVTQGADGSARATAADAVVFGESAHLEARPRRPADIGGWADLADAVRWTVRLDRPGRYRVAVELACPPASSGSTYEVAVGDQRVSGTVPATRGWEDYVPIDLGTVDVGTAGPAGGGDLAVVVRPTHKAGDQVMNLRSVTLRPDVPTTRPGSPPAAPVPGHP